MGIAGVLHAKGTDVACVGPDTSVEVIVAEMNTRRIGAMLVIDGESVVGLVSERDVIRALAGHREQLHEVRLSEDARTAFLDLYAQALTRHGRPLSAEVAAYSQAHFDQGELRLELRAAPGAVVTITSPAGVLTLHGLAAGLSVHAATTDRRAEA